MQLFSIECLFFFFLLVWAFFVIGSKDVLSSVKTPCENVVRAVFI